jgi:hypothetical protein
MTQDEIYVPIERYVYYNDQGEITSISNTKDLDDNYITVNLEKVINFLTGKESASSYLVIYDTLLKRYVLKLKYYADETAYRVDDELHKIKTEIDQKPDLIVTQDIKNNRWVFTVDDGLRSYLESQEAAYNKTLQFSITRKNDPHELYRLIILNFKQLIENNFVEIPFKYQTEESDDDLSVYTNKRFEKYLYEVKK